MTLQSIFMSVILGFSSNLDFVAIGLTFGTRKLDIP